jgi:hypothetical protein
MWRGSGCLPRHAARRGQKGYPVQKKVPQGLFIKIIFKKVNIKKLSFNLPVEHYIFFISAE